VALELVGIDKVVDGERWLDDIHLTLAEGLNVLAGPTLAGKTTLMRILAGLEPATSGQIFIDGEDVTAVSVRKRDVAVVYQEFVNYPSLTVFENIAAPLRRREKMRDADVRRRVGEVSDLLRLGPFLERRPDELSGGQQQRVAIARALARSPKVLILDEPLANLDYKLREELRDELNRIFEAGNSIVVYSTSEPVEALTLGGPTVVMHEGRILQVGPAVDAFHHPASSEVARVFSDPPMNLRPAHVVGGNLVLDGGAEIPRPDHFADLVDGAIVVGLRPHLVRLRNEGSDSLAIGGELVLAELTGSATYLHVRSPNGGTIIAEVPGVHSHPEGEHLDLFIHPRSLYAFDADSGSLLASPDEASSNG